MIDTPELTPPTEDWVQVPATHATQWAELARKAEASLHA
jgi:hypothetical protein